MHDSTNAKPKSQPKYRRPGEPDLPKVFLPGGSDTIIEASIALGRLLAATGKYFRRDDEVVRFTDGINEYFPLRLGAACIAFEEVAELYREDGLSPIRGHLQAAARMGDAMAILKCRDFTEQFPPVPAVGCQVFLTDREFHNAGG